MDVVRVAGVVSIGLHWSPLVSIGPGAPGKLSQGQKSVSLAHVCRGSEVDMATDGSVCLIPAEFVRRPGEDRAEFLVGSVYR